MLPGSSDEVYPPAPAFIPFLAQFCDEAEFGSCPTPILEDPIGICCETSLAGYFVELHTPGLANNSTSVGSFPMDVVARSTCSKRDM
jgi:hypothetical protein